MSKGSGNEDAETIRTEDFVDRFQDTMVYSSGKLTGVNHKIPLKVQILLVRSAHAPLQAHTEDRLTHANYRI